MQSDIIGNHILRLFLQIRPDVLIEHIRSAIPDMLLIPATKQGKLLLCGDQPVLRLERQLIAFICKKAFPSLIILPLQAQILIQQSRILRSQPVNPADRGFSGRIACLNDNLRNMLRADFTP